MIETYAKCSQCGRELNSSDSVGRTNKYKYGDFEFTAFGEVIEKPGFKGVAIVGYDPRSEQLVKPGGVAEAKDTFFPLCAKCRLLVHMYIVGKEVEHGA